MTIERNRYFTGQRLDEDDFTEEQRYLREKARRHNRMVHGWGIVCGLGVRPGAAGGEVRVEPGYALDPNGDEIVVEEELTVDLCNEDDDGNAVLPGRPLYVAIRYAECMTRPVPVGESVEYSRVHETFAVRALTELPASYRQQPSSREPDSHPCPDLPVEPWVVLAELALGSNLEISNVDCRSHHRRVGTNSARTTIVGECDSKT